MKAGKRVALEHNGATPGASQQRGANAPGRPAADNRHVIHLAAHWAPKVAKAAEVTSDK
jgi:hypothetical protein